METEQQITPLCEIAYKYGTDKCPQFKHRYTPFYYNLLNEKKENIKKVLELGIGYNEMFADFTTAYDKTLKRVYHKGASLYMWRDFLPNAQIYGIDIQPETMVKDERIITYVVDERKRSQLVDLIKKIGSDIDLVIDDGSHLKKNQLNACLMLMPLLKKDVIYIIEDVSDVEYITTQLSKQYNCVVPLTKSIKRKDDNLILVTNK